MCNSSVNSADYPLAGGNFSFNETCEAERDIVVRKVIDGKTIEVK